MEQEKKDEIRIEKGENDTGTFQKHQRNIGVKIHQTRKPTVWGRVRSTTIQGKC